MQERTGYSLKRVTHSDALVGLKAQNMYLTAGDKCNNICATEFNLKSLA
jgi:hypothetical protein